MGRPCREGFGHLRIAAARGFPFEPVIFAPADCAAPFGAALLALQDHFDGYQRQA
jgi:hypothetical protein